MRVGFILFVLLNNWNLSSSAVTGPSTLPVTKSPNGNANSSVGPKTSLEAVYEDLSIVSRVINGVALQIAAQTVKHQEVISELLRVRQEDFNDLINISPDPVINAVKALFEHSNDQSTQHVDTSFLYRYTSFNDGLNRGNMTLSMWENISTADFKNLLNFKSQKIDKLVECDKKILEVVAEFHKMEKGDDKLSKIEQTTRFTNLKGNLGSLVDCLNNGHLTSKGAEKTLLTQVEPLKGTQILETQLVRFFADKDILDNFDANFQRLSDEMDRLNETSLTGNVSGILENAMKIHERIVDPNVHITVNLGLKYSPADISRVLEDVRSPWFREKVARGQDVEPLAAALTQIQVSVTIVEKLGNNWKQVTEVFKKTKRAIDIVARSLKVVESFGDSKATRSFLAATKITFNKCRPNTTFIIKNNTIPDFEQEFKNIETIFSAVITIKNTLDFIAKTFNFPNLIMDLNFLKGIIPLSLPEAQLDDLRNNLQSSSKFASVLTFFEQVRKLFDAQKDVSDVLKLSSFSEAATLFKDIKTALESTGYIKMLKCYQGEQLDTVRFGKVFEFVLSIHQLTDPQAFNATKTYLMGIKTVRSDYDELKKRIASVQGNKDKVDFKPVLKLKNPHKVSLQLTEGLAVIREMVRVQKREDVLREPYSSDVLSVLQKADPSGFWKDPMKTIDALLIGLQNLEKTVSLNRNSANLTTTWTVFSEAEKVPGIPNSQEVFSKVAGNLQIYNTKPDFQSAIKNAEELEDWDLDFASHKKALGSAFLVYNPIAEYFDDVFGFKKQQSEPEVVVFKNVPTHSFFATVGICIGIFLLMIIVAIIGYGFTKKGRERYTNTYLYYFPDYKEFERRWRYSLFLDRENGDNALLDASREINPENVEIALKKGAYVNVYNFHGNTALHMATNKGFAAIVELLIRNGADRSLLNYRNKLPEQFIPENYKELRNAASFTKIMQIYEKHRNKNYRMQVPRVLATHRFHIFIEKRTEDNLTNSFMEKYPGITSEEPLLTTTHCVCKTSSDGILETDDFELLSWIFNGVIIVKESWMEACIRNNKTIREDYNFLIEHVRYQGSLYKNCILPWSQARSKGTMPFLCGVAVTIVMTECPLVGIYATLIKALGGDLLNDFPDPENYTPGSHPYLHTNRGPLFLIHDGKQDLSAYSKDPMFSLFTEPEFIDFLLKREIQQDTSPDPIPIPRDIPTQ